MQGTKFGAQATKFWVYNDRPYAERGWCCFEEGVAQIVVAHLTEQAQSGQLPRRHAQAESCRPKLIALGEDGVRSKGLQFRFSPGAVPHMVRVPVPGKILTHLN